MVAATKVPTHPLAVIAVVLSACGIVPLPVVGGLLGSSLGAIALGAIARDPRRRGGDGLAWAAIGIGAVTGILPFVLLVLIVDSIFSGGN